MLNKTKPLYGDELAYKIKIEKGVYKTYSHKEVREMVDALGTALINMGLKNKTLFFKNYPLFGWIFNINFIHYFKIKIYLPQF